MSKNAHAAAVHPNHHVQFYESDAYLTDVVVRFLRAGLSSGDPLVVIATPEHRDKFATALQAEGFDFEHSLRNDKIVLVDAQHMLSTFMVNGMPHDDIFRKELGAVIDRASAGRRGVTVRAFGEMVNVLWCEGNSEAAIRLEELWNGLVATREFSLLCAYTMGNFAGEVHSRKFEQICRQHAHISPTEQYMDARDDQARLIEISFLQQRARSLESEIERRKGLEASLRDLVLREQSARNEAEYASRLKDEFLAILSHELRTPLNAILGWTQIVETRKDPATVSRALEVVQRNAKLQLNLINDLLDVSRIITGKMAIKTEPVDLGQVVRAALDTVRPSVLTKGIDIEISVEEPAPFVTGDADRLQQVVWNLLTNAIKFTPKGEKVELRLEQSDSDIQIVVRDRGVGIDPEFLPYVFDRFRQADTGTTRKVGGLGLGLAVVRYLVEAHGGTVSAESAGVGLGATFTVKLPISMAAGQNQCGPVLEEKRTLEGCHILVIDDERDTCDLFKFVLEDCGARVGVAASAGEALKMLASRSFDLILADIGMPRQDGFAMISAIRAHPRPHVRGVRAIAVTSYAGDYFRARALSAGFDDYITKPVQPLQLEKIIADHLMGRVA